MRTREARTRANAAWRSRTPAKPVQVYLHADTLAKLDALVVERGAPGRAAVLAELIEAAAEARQHLEEPAAQPALPEPVREPAPPRGKPRARERAILKRDLRAAARECAKAGDEAGRRLAARGWWERAGPAERRKAPSWLLLPW